MSYVTNAILAFSVIEGDDDDAQWPLPKVNEFFGGEPGFVGVDDPKLPRGWYGGTKMLETNVAIGAFNYLDIEGLVKHLRSIAWQEPDRVQLIVQEQQDDDRFRIITLDGEQT